MLVFILRHLQSSLILSFHYAKREKILPEKISRINSSWPFSEKKRSSFFGRSSHLESRTRRFPPILKKRRASGCREVHSAHGRRQEKKFWMRNSRDLLIERHTDISDYRRRGRYPATQCASRDSEEEENSASNNFLFCSTKIKHNQKFWWFFLKLTN